MWSFAFALWLTWSCTDAQRSGRGDGNGWDIRLAVPGEPGADYPTLATIPRTSFSCSGKAPGYYADLETNCQVFRVCTLGSTYGFQSFICPNGTLFNQAVFVCDWWMNVDCDKSQNFFPANTMKFGRLKLGQQLMKDIKKMITYPMHNPYDKSTMKSNFIVMQDYRPPSSQMNVLFADAPYINALVPPKQYAGYNLYNTNEISFAASTASPQYLAPSPNSAQSNGQSEVEVFQRQKQYSQLNTLQNQFSNSHAGRYTQGSNGFMNNGNQGQNRVTNNNVNSQKPLLRQYAQYNNIPTQNNNAKQTEFGVSFSRQRLNNQNADKDAYTYNQGSPQFSEDMLGKIGNEAKQNLVSNNISPNNKVIAKTLTFNRIIKDPNNNTPKSRITFKTWIVKPSKSARLVAEPSSYTYNRPTKPPAAKLIAQPTPYTYNRPTTAKLIAEPQPTPYTYNRPTTAKLISEPQPTAYTYNRPTTARLELATEGYTYNKPTTPQKIITTRETPRDYIPPSTPRPTLPSRLYLNPTTSTPTKASIVYLPPTTFKPLGRLYLSPSQAPTLPSRQYLPSSNEQERYRQSARIQVNPDSFTIPTKNYLAPDQAQKERLQISPKRFSPSAQQYLTPNGDQSAKLQAAPNSDNENENNPSFSLIKHSRINALRNNLTFADILTKEKLDITVNDIVKDTSSILQTASPEKFGRITQEETELSEPNKKYLAPNTDTRPVSQTASPEKFGRIIQQDEPKPTQPNKQYLTPETDSESAEILTSQTPVVSSQSAKIIQAPASDLEAPVQSTNGQSISSNKFANLPFYKESLGPTNTIERTVSLKISIPEKVATYLFKSQNETDNDRLEILNTGNSNYLVLASKYNKRPDINFIPLGKLIVDKNSNFSNSQALVFSFLSDSINAVKEYSNIAQQNIVHSSASSQTLTDNSEDISQISNQVSRLTASQYSGSYNDNQNNAYTATQDVSANRDGKHSEFSGNTVKSSQYNLPSAQQTQQPYTQGQFQSNQAVSTNNVNGYNSNLELNNNQIYSGQLYRLPVPEVANHLNSGHTAAKLIQANNIRQQSTEINNLQNSFTQSQNSNADVSPLNTLYTQPDTDKEASSEVEIIESNGAPRDSGAAKLQAAPASQGAESEENEDSAHSIISNLFKSSQGISAHLQDKIFGTIPHPSEENKLLTYKKDNSYYVFTNLENNGLSQSNQINNLQNSLQDQRNAKIIQNYGNGASFQIIPSLGFQLEDEAEQRKFLETFQIDEYGNPKQLQGVNGYQITRPNEKQQIATDLDYSVEHTQSAKQVDGRYNVGNGLYVGPSSYSAPQASVGSLDNRLQQNNRLEQLDETNYNNNNNYAKVTPARQFLF